MSTHKDKFEKMNKTNLVRVFSAICFLLWIKKRTQYQWKENRLWDRTLRSSGLLHFQSVGLVCLNVFSQSNKFIRLSKRLKQHKLHAIHRQTNRSEDSVSQTSERRSEQQDLPLFILSKRSRLFPEELSLLWRFDVCCSNEDKDKER